VLVYSTYLGGTESEAGASVAVDNGGNAYVTGFTTSADFPTQNPNQGFRGAVNVPNAFITKLDPTGSTLVYSTFLGGTGGEIGLGIAVDPISGSAYVTGTTASGRTFPLVNALAADLRGGPTDMFVTRLRPDGTLLWSTFLGGSGQENPSIGGDPQGPGAGLPSTPAGTPTSPSGPIRRTSDAQPVPTFAGRLPHSPARTPSWPKSCRTDRTLSTLPTWAAWERMPAPPIAVDNLGHAYVTAPPTRPTFQPSTRTRGASEGAPWTAS